MVALQSESLAPELFQLTSFCREIYEIHLPPGSYSDITIPCGVYIYAARKFETPRPRVEFELHIPRSKTSKEHDQGSCSYPRTNLMISPG